jgi:hypothetical protein
MVATLKLVSTSAAHPLLCVLAARAVGIAQRRISQPKVCITARFRFSIVQAHSGFGWVGKQHAARPGFEGFKQARCGSASRKSKFWPLASKQALGSPRRSGHPTHWFHKFPLVFEQLIGCSRKLRVHVKARMPSASFSVAASSLSA